MPLLIPKPSALRYERSYGGRPSITMGDALTSDSVANQFPSTYTELFASTEFDTTWINVTFHSNFAIGTDTSSLVSLYKGAAASEQPFIEYLAAGWVGPIASGYPVKRYGFPVRIPAGTRISARHQSVRTSQSVYIMVELLGEPPGSHWVGSGVECVGESTSTSRGTTVTPGGFSNGTLTSIGTNTYDWGYVLPVRHGQPSGDTSMNTGLGDMDLASGSDTANLIEGLDSFMCDASNNEYTWTVSEGRYCHVPAGTTLYLRSQFSGTAEDQDFLIYGVY